MMDDGRATRRLGNVAVNSGTRSGSVEMIIDSAKKIDNNKPLTNGVKLWVFYSYFPV
jgi:hypothetical protein